MRELFLPAMAAGAGLAASVMWLVGLLTGRIQTRPSAMFDWARRLWAGPRRGGSSRVWPRERG